MKEYLIDDINTTLQEKIESYKNPFGALYETMKVEVYEPKDSIISFNKPIHKLRFLIEGRAKITLVHEDGKQSIVHFVHPGEYLGELTFLDIEKVHKNVSAISRCTFIVVDMKLALNTLKADPSFLYELCQFVGDKMLTRTYFSSKSQNYELKNRLAAYILTTEDHGLYSEKHTETAEYLGVSYRHLLYTIKELIEEGVLAKTKQGYTFDQQILKQLALDIILL